MKPTPSVPEGFCQISCSRCNCDLVKRCLCTDTPPSAWYTCKQQKVRRASLCFWAKKQASSAHHAALLCWVQEWGACNQPFMLSGDAKHPTGWCQTTCGRCSC